MVEKAISHALAASAANRGDQLVDRNRNQADLAGILNTLYEMHIVLLSVNMLRRSND